MMSKRHETSKIFRAGLTRRCWDVGNSCSKFCCYLVSQRRFPLPVISSTSHSPCPYCPPLSFSSSPLRANILHSSMSKLLVELYSSASFETRTKTLWHADWAKRFSKAARTLEQFALESLSCCAQQALCVQPAYCKL